MKQSKHYSTNIIIEKIIAQLTRSFKHRMHEVESNESTFRRGQIDSLKTLKLWWLENGEDIIEKAEVEELKKETYLPDLVKTIMDVTDRLKPELSFHNDEDLILKLKYEDNPVDTALRETIRALSSFNLKGEKFRAGEDIYILTKWVDTQEQETRETTRTIYFKLVKDHK